MFPWCTFHECPFISLASCHKSSKLVFKYTYSVFIDSPTLVLYMSSSFWLFRVESRDFSQAEKERSACKFEKMTAILTQKDNLGPF